MADYDLIEVDTETFGELGVNVLMIDHETVVAQSRHRQLHARLEAQGLNVIAIEFDQHVTLGGGIRCASAPWYREPSGTGD